MFTPQCSQLGAGKGGELVEDQVLERGNAALATSTETKKPVRVVRGYNMKDSRYAPTSGYRYDGLYTVTKHWSERKKGAGGKKFVVWRFELKRVAGQGPIPKKKVMPVLPFSQSKDFDEEEAKKLKAKQQFCKRSDPKDPSLKLKSKRKSEPSQRPK